MNSICFKITLLHCTGYLCFFEIWNDQNCSNQLLLPRVQYISALLSCSIHSPRHSFTNPSFSSLSLSINPPTAQIFASLLNFHSLLFKFAIFPSLFPISLSLFFFLSLYLVPLGAVRSPAKSMCHMTPSPTPSTSRSRERESVHTVTRVNTEI